MIQNVGLKFIERRGDVGMPVIAIVPMVTIIELLQI